MKEDTRRQAGQINAFVVHNHIHAATLGPDSAQAVLDLAEQRIYAIRQAVLDIVPESLNAWGVLHGGAYYTLADAACGRACREDGRSYVTLNGALSFMKAARSGRVTALARILRRGRSTTVIHVEITSGDKTLLACGEFTFFCTSG